MPLAEGENVDGDESVGGGVGGDGIADPPPANEHEGVESSGGRAGDPLAAVQESEKHRTDPAMQAPLNEADGRTLKTAVHAMAERLVGRRNTEKTSAVLEPKAPPGAVDTPEPEKQAAAGHRRNGAAAFTGANRVAVAHTTLQSGDPCPACRQGKVYRQKEPATLIRIVGQPPLAATVFEMERLRCNGCGEVFTAGEPPSAGAEKFDATAVVMIALLKYATGMPFN